MAESPRGAGHESGDDDEGVRQLADAARAGDVRTLAALIEERPSRRDTRVEPYGFSLLHLAAKEGQLGAVDYLLRLGLDPNVRERGDETSPMHWAAAGGHLDVVTRLADAGGDVVGEGDDHALGVIGWATCWGVQHEAVVAFLVSRGARHHIFSAVSMNLADEVRRIVRETPGALHERLTRSDGERTPLHHAVLAGRAEMVALLLDLGADPLARDGDGFLACAYATATEVDRPVLAALRRRFEHEIESTRRGERPVAALPRDLLALVALHEWELAERVVRDSPRSLSPGDSSGGALHLMAKRGDDEAVRWLLRHGADPNARWAHWDADVTALHLAALGGHPSVVPALLEFGADPAIRDSKHDGDALDWAEFFERDEIVALLRARAGRA